MAKVAAIITAVRHGEFLSLSGLSLDWSEVSASEVLVQGMKAKTRQRRIVALFRESGSLVTTSSQALEARSPIPAKCVASLTGSHRGICRFDASAQRPPAQLRQLSLRAAPKRKPHSCRNGKFPCNDLSTLSSSRYTGGRRAILVSCPLAHIQRDRLRRLKDPERILAGKVSSFKIWTMEVDPKKLFLARMKQPRVSYEEALRQTQESLRRSREQGFENRFDCAKIRGNGCAPRRVIVASEIATKALLPPRLKRRRTISTGPVKLDWRLLAAFMSGSFRKSTAYEAIILTSRFLPRLSRWAKAMNTWFSSIPESNRVFKRTRGSAYGVILDDDYEIDPTTQQYKGYLWFREALPSEYLSRLALTNRHFGDDVHFEGITSAAGNNPSIITSQTFIKGDDPIVAEVQEFMKAAGFKSVRRELIRSETVGRNTWYRAKDGLLVLDAKSANFKKGENGNLFPIDLPIRYLPDNQALNLRGLRR